jgi:hypothetical protein
MNCYHLGVRWFSANRIQLSCVLTYMASWDHTSGLARTNFASGCASTGFRLRPSGGALMPMYFAAQQL